MDVVLIRGFLARLSDERSESAKGVRSLLFDPVDMRLRKWFDRIMDEERGDGALTR